MRIFKKIVPFFLITLLISCHGAEDYRYSRANYSLDCSTIRSKLADTERRKEELRKHDGFRLRHMLILPAIAQTLKIQTQEKKFDEDLYQLRNLVIAKGCNNPAKLNAGSNTSASVNQRGLRNSPFYNPYLQYYNKGNSNVSAGQAPQQYNGYGVQPQQYSNQYNYNRNQQPSYGNGQAGYQPQAYQQGGGSYYNQAPQQAPQYGSYTTNNSPGYQGYATNDMGYGGIGSDPIASRYMKQLK